MVRKHARSPWVKPAQAESLAKSNPFAELADMVRAPKMAYRLALGIALQMFQQLTGANFFFCRLLHDFTPITQ